MDDAAQILNEATRDKLHTAEELLPLVYDELRRFAASKIAREAAVYTLQPTALVHEAWLRLSQESQPGWKNREQFYAVAAEVMRRILVDRARRRRTVKHGGDRRRVELETIELPVPRDDDVILRVHEALERLESQDAQKAEVVKLRFFVGLENSEVSALLGISERTVQRHWTFAKAWLFCAMRKES